jgi:hypothetical protein
MRLKVRPWRHRTIFAAETKPKSNRFERGANRAIRR